MYEDKIRAQREMLRANDWGLWATVESDQHKKIAAPPAQKAYPADAPLIDLVPPEGLAAGEMPLAAAIGQRRSHRRYSEAPLTLEELSFLLWAAQGVRAYDPEHALILRTAPSAGACHPFELYLAVHRVEGLAPGLYRYLGVEHKLLPLAAGDLSAAVGAACMGQTFAGRGAATFIWTALPYRTEWRYHIVAHRSIAMDVGHSCQNLYLAATAIGAGTCAIGAYGQAAMDELVGVDGEEEFVIYVAPVGKLP